jgi:hypothetical protein
MVIVKRKTEKDFEIPLTLPVQHVSCSLNPPPLSLVSQLRWHIRLGKSVLEGSLNLLARFKRVSSITLAR